MFRFLANNVFRKVINASVEGLADNNTPKRFKAVLIKWLFFGAGFAVMCAMIIALVSWYSSRPKPWNPAALKATFDSFDLESKSYKLIFYYILENATSADYELRPTSKSRMMQKLKRQDSLIVGNGVLYDNPLFIPAKKKIRFSIELDASFKEYFPSNILTYDREKRSKTIAEFAKKEMANLDGFVLFDEARRYEIDFPRSW